LLDDRQFHALAGVRLVGVQLPALAAVLRRDQHDLRAGETEQRHLDLTGEQLAQPHRCADFRDIGRVAVSRPAGAADPQPAHHHRRSPAEQMDVQIAAKRDLAIIFGRRPSSYGLAQHVPVEQNQSQRHQPDQHQADPARPGLSSAGSANGGVDRIVRPDPIAKFARTRDHRRHAPKAQLRPEFVPFQHFGPVVGSNSWTNAPGGVWRHGTKRPFASKRIYNPNHAQLS
jgi:hypothetical protein